jgi:hypothetical protein
VMELTEAGSHWGYGDLTVVPEPEEPLSNSNADIPRE